MNHVEWLTSELDRMTGLWIKAQDRVHILTTALKQCRIYSECYDELIMTIDEALNETGIETKPE